MLLFFQTLLSKVSLLPSADKLLVKLHNVYRYPLLTVDFAACGEEEGICRVTSWIDGFTHVSNSSGVLEPLPNWHESSTVQT